MLRLGVVRTDRPNDLTGAHPAPRFLTLFHLSLDFRSRHDLAEPEAGGRGDHAPAPLGGSRRAGTNFIDVVSHTVRPAGAADLFGPRACGSKWKLPAQSPLTKEDKIR